MDKKIDLIKDDLLSLIIKYMVPSIFGMLGLASCIFLDTMFIGWGIGNLGLASLNIAIPTFNLFNSIGAICGVGGATALAISIGRKKYESLDEIFTLSVFVATVIGIVLTIFGTIFIDDIVNLLGASSDTFSYVKSYLLVVLSGSLGFILQNAINVFVRNDGNPKLSMWSIIFSNLTNIIFDYIFIFPLEMGMKGAALATVMAQFVGLFVLSFHFIKKKNTINFKFEKLRFRFLKRIVTNGLPSFVLEVSSGLVIFMFNIKIGEISGDLALSAYSIIANVALIFIAIFNGISQGLQPIFGVNFGGGQTHRVLNSYKIGRNIALGFGLVFFLIGFLKPEWIVNIFSKDTEMLMEISVNGIRIYFIGFIIMGVNILNVGLMQAIEKSKISTMLSLLRGLVLIVIVLNLFSKYFGLNGVWMTIPIVEGITFIVSTLLIKRDREIYGIN